MEEKDILLLEKEVETKSKVEPKVEPKVSANVFSSSTFVEEKPQKVDTKPAVKQERESFSKVVEKPNFDFIEELSPEEEKKIYKIERGERESKQNKFALRLKLAMFSLVVAVCSIWGIVNLVDIASLQAEISSVSEVYNLNLVNYLSKLATLDTASNYNDLFPTYPSAENPPSSIAKSSNWFNRICDFIARLFGG